MAVGCATGSTSNTARTCTEQLLLANAIDQSLDKVSFTNFAGTNVFLQDKYIECVDKNYVIASTRHRLLAAGAHLVDSADKADVVLEMRSGAVGTNSDTAFIGTPEIALPGMLTIPEVKIAERRKQQAIAKLGMVAIDPKTNAVLGTGGTTLSSSIDSNWFVAGVGPYQTGALKNEVQNSTTGAAARQQGHIPVRVAFSSPPKLPTDSPTQIATDVPAGEPAAKSQIKPAGHTDEGAAWAK
ncbi:DUF6655 family protein [Planctomicrobium sp. SH527]|uniref:DUF6655 family protein n=1 Tax=Planctomicrobium sp. SH527 TaxID=3448123 RepID=UPI003F5CB9B4